MEYWSGRVDGNDSDILRIHQVIQVKTLDELMQDEYNGKIIDIPPLKFKKHIYVEKYNAVSDALNKGAQTKEIFSGTIEEYKKQKK